MKLFRAASAVAAACVLAFSSASAAGASAANTPAPAGACIKLGGTANIDAVEPTKGFVVAMTGDFEGGAFARIIGGPRDLGNGVSEYDLEHFFVRADGSSIQTRDKSVWRKVEGSDNVFVENTYHVVKTTGALEGKTGTFRSWGGFKLKEGLGILRFDGELCPASAK